MKKISEKNFSLSINHITQKSLTPESHEHVKREKVSKAEPLKNGDSPPHPISFSYSLTLGSFIFKMGT